ncbi:Alpha/Beta hydrolase protein [Zopfochytrium polystomum]|nr:Alpha/Beta hydrolase protein [Zopfochytrium polystomum]
MFVVDLASALLNAIVRLALVLATALLWPLVFIYPIILGLLLLDVPQRAILFLHHVNFPFWTDFSKPEVFGFSPSKVRNLTLRTSDGVKIGAWHILPSGYYRKVNSELEKKAIAAGASPRDLRKKGSMIGLQEQLQALKERPVFLYFHGNAGNRAAPRRIDTYRGISERLNANVLAIDYRGFGDSQGTPTEDGLAKDARAAWDYLTIECGVAADQIILIGHSLGTGVAARLGARSFDGREGCQTARSSFAVAVCIYS